MVTGAFEDTAGDFAKFEVGGIDFQMGCLFVEWGSFLEQAGDDGHWIIALEEWTVGISRGAGKDILGCA